MRRCWAVALVVLCSLIGWLWAGNAGAGLLGLWAWANEGFVGLRSRAGQHQQAWAATVNGPGFLWLSGSAVVGRTGRSSGGWCRWGQPGCLFYVFADELSAAEYAKLRRELITPPANLALR